MHSPEMVAEHEQEVFKFEDTQVINYDTASISYRNEDNV